MYIDRSLYICRFTEREREGEIPRDAEELDEMARERKKKEGTRIKMSVARKL